MKISACSPMSSWTRVADLGQLLGRRPAVRRARRGAGRDLLAQAGDPDLEELVEHVREDRQELDPLERRVPLVPRLVQDARVVVEPGEFPIQVGRGSVCRSTAVTAPCSRRADHSRPKCGHRGEAPSAVPALGRAADRSTLTSPFGAVPPFTRSGVHPDPHLPAGRGIDERLLGPQEARLEGGVGLAATGPGRQRRPFRVLGAVATLVPGRWPGCPRHRTGRARGRPAARPAGARRRR